MDLNGCPSNEENNCENELEHEFSNQDEDIDIDAPYSNEVFVMKEGNEVNPNEDDEEV
ncbi:hypothetical protein RYX36_014152 [Vicia faba]